MAKVPQDKIMKSLVLKVKELCKDADDNSIQILLQQYDFNVEQTIQAFLDGSAEESLREWTSLGGGTKATSSKKKRKNKNKNSAQNVQNSNVSSANATGSELSVLCNGVSLTDSFHLNGASHLDEPEMMMQHRRVPAYEEPLHKATAQPSRPKEDYKQQTKKARDRTLSEASTSSGIEKASKNPHAGLEKSCKDLQRQTVALHRLKTVLNEQTDKSFKRITEVFKELHNELNQREAMLIFEMDKVKSQAGEILEDQQHKAAALKLQTDRAQAMRETEVAELRSRIKFFVSERKHYEDLSQTQRFVCDFNHMLEELKKFGEVVPVKTSSDNRRASLVSLGSSNSHDDVTSPNKFSSVPPNFTSQTSSSSQHIATSVSVTTSTITAHASKASAAVNVPAAERPAAATAATSAKTAAPVVTPAVFVPNSAHVLKQSESLTRYEATEMAQRLANLSINGATESSSVSSVSSTAKPSRPDRGRGSRGRGGGSSTRDNDRSGRPDSGDHPREQKSARGQGSSYRGGRGQGRSNRGQGQNRPANDSSADHDHYRSDKSGLTSAQQSNTNEVNGPASPKSPTNREAQSSKSPANSPRRGGRQGGRQDGGRASGDSSAKARVNTNPVENQVGDHHDNSDGVAEKSVSRNSDKKPSSDGLTNGEAEALPQRGNRTNRRGRGGPRQGPGSQKVEETPISVLTNGE